MFRRENNGIVKEKKSPFVGFLVNGFYSIDSRVFIGLCAVEKKVRVKP